MDWNVIVKVVPSVCALVGLISAHYHGYNSELTVYVLLAILGIDVVSLKIGKKE